MCVLHKQLNDNDRFYIEQRLAEGDSFNQITRILDCAHSTISREIKYHLPNNFHSVYCHRDRHEYLWWIKPINSAVSARYQISRRVRRWRRLLIL
ncbi:helix-turn-helix domain-containing protein [Candidatus Enterovibrio escicola]|uniref:helix-turn-helix domain-containing protein n=1 Tax=Candidatus Enterovibrio escicola TaxID=1927127 RepID=UPI001CC22490